MVKAPVRLWGGRAWNFRYPTTRRSARTASIRAREFTLEFSQSWSVNTWAWDYFRSMNDHPNKHIRAAISVTKCVVANTGGTDKGDPMKPYQCDVILTDLEEISDDLARVQIEHDSSFLSAVTG
jgi:peptidoglycan/xylan/chitin deacetylase (PgdA/CDA1 family)